MPVIDLSLLKMVGQFLHQLVKSLGHPFNCNELMISTAFKAVGFCEEQAMSAIIHMLKIQGSFIQHRLQHHLHQ
ncbi:hypothetical protein D3C77_725210 [compost metagenome]